MKEEHSIFISRLRDIIARAEDRSYEITTDFLDLTQRSISEKALKSEKGLVYEFWGGYEDAERTIAFIRPNFIEESDYGELALLRVKKTLKGRELSHRDYLGSILGLGVKREKVGDIIVREDGADIFVKRELVDFFTANFIKVGHQNIETLEIPLNEVMISKSQGEQVTDTVASLRADNLVSAMFKISRKESVTYIKQGRVFLNDIEMKKPDKEIKEGDKITLRGKGRAYLNKINNRSRKNRLYIDVTVFKK